MSFESEPSASSADDDRRRTGGVPKIRLRPHPQRALGRISSRSKASPATSATVMTANRHTSPMKLNCRAARRAPHGVLTQPETPCPFRSGERRCAAPGWPPATPPIPDALPGRPSDRLTGMVGPVGAHRGRRSRTSTMPMRGGAGSRVGIVFTPAPAQADRRRRAFASSPRG